MPRILVTHRILEVFLGSNCLKVDHLKSELVLTSESNFWGLKGLSLSKMTTSSLNNEDYGDLELVWALKTP